MLEGLASKLKVCKEVLGSRQSSVDMLLEVSKDPNTGLEFVQDMEDMLVEESMDPNMGLEFVQDREFVDYMGKYLMYIHIQNGDCRTMDQLVKHKKVADHKVNNLMEKTIFRNHYHCPKNY